MAYKARGNPEEAQRWLSKANTLTDEALKKHESRAKPMAWNRRLTRQLLRKEAEALITQGKPGGPPAGKGENESPKEKPKENVKSKP